MTALMKTKSFKDCNLKGKRILGGSDPVTWEMIEAFVSKGAIVQPNWGMSEIGPTAINIVFHDLDQIKEVKRQSPLPLDKWSILGNNYYCDWKMKIGSCLLKAIYAFTMAGLTQEILLLQIYLIIYITKVENNVTLFFKNQKFKL